MQQLTFFAAEPPASRSALRGCGKGWLTLAATSCSPLALLQSAIGQDLSFGKTFPESCHLAADGILEPSSGCWSNSGMGSHIGFLTLSLSEHGASPLLSPNADAVCSLSGILETGAVPQRYFLTAKACQGILRRAEKRGKKLPMMLLAALSAVAEA